MACVAFSIVALSTAWSHSRSTHQQSETKVAEDSSIEARPQPQRRQAIDSLYAETREWSNSDKPHEYPNPNRQVPIGELVSLCARLAQLLRTKEVDNTATQSATVELLGDLSSLTASLCRVQQRLLKNPVLLSAEPGLESCFEATLSSLQANLLSLEASVCSSVQSTGVISNAGNHVREHIAMLASFLIRAEMACVPPTPPPEVVVEAQLRVGESGSAHLQPTPVFDSHTGITPAIDDKCWTEPPPEYSPPARGSPPIQTEKTGDQLEVQATLTQSPERDDNPTDSGALYDAVTTDDSATLNNLLSKGANASTQFGDLRRTALHQAAHLNHHFCIPTLLSHGAIMSLEDAKGDTALHLAAWAGNVEALNTLISHGAEVDWLSGRDGYSALWCAISAHHIDAARLLLKHGARVSLRSASGCGLMPLHQAAVTGQSAMVELLLERGAQVDCVDDDRNTPLHYASASGSVASVKILLRHGANVEAMQVHGLSAVHWASHKGHTEVLKALLDHGARLDRKAEEGATPLHLAANRGHVNAVRLLLERGASKRIKDAAWDGVGGTPAAMARAKGHHQLAKILKV